MTEWFSVIDLEFDISLVFNSDMKLCIIRIPTQRLQPISSKSNAKATNPLHVSYDDANNTMDLRLSKSPQFDRTIAWENTVMLDCNESGEVGAIEIISAKSILPPNFSSVQYN